MSKEVTDGGIYPSPSSIPRLTMEKGDHFESHTFPSGGWKEWCQAMFENGYYALKLQKAGVVDGIVRRLRYKEGYEWLTPRPRALAL